MQQDVRTKLAELEQACRRAGAKVTHQRREVLCAVINSGAHPDAATVLERVRARVPSISFDTVYRTLAFLEAHGLIRRVQLTSEPTRYDGEVTAHHHFVCTDCGRIFDFKSEALDALELPRAATALGSPTWRQLNVFGVCQTCRSVAPRRSTPQGGRHGKSK